MIRAQVKAWSDQFDQNKEMFLVSLGEGKDTYIITFDASTKGLDIQFQRESELEDK